MATILKNPILRIEIEGKRQITDYYLKEEYTLVEKNDGIISIDVNSSPAASGWTDIMLSAIDIVNKIILEAPSLSTITNSLRIIKTDSTTDIVGIDGIQIISFNDTEGAKVRNVQIKTTSTSKVDFNYKILSV